MIIKLELMKLLARQDIGKQMVWDTLPMECKEEYEVNADEIIALFVEAIKGLEFNVPKHYHEKINSAFVFPPCKSYKILP